MKRTLLIVVILFVISCPLSAGTVELIEKLLPTSVTIYDYNSGAAIGSGMIISRNGKIMTCKHVVEDIKKVKIEVYNGTSVRKYVSQSIKRKKNVDVAIIKINAKGLTPVKFGDSDKVKIGQTIIAIGAPRGLTQSVTVGIVSGLDRTFWLDGVLKKSLIQTTIPISPGSSGSPVFDESGKIIGMVSIGTRGGYCINFCIPSNQFKEIK